MRHEDEFGPVAAVYPRSGARMASGFASGSSFGGDHGDDHGDDPVSDTGRAAGGQSNGQCGGRGCGQSFRAAPGLDPYKVAREEPLRWAAFINEVYPRHDAEVMLHFGVCEKTVRWWRSGERAPRSHHRTIAERRHGEVARRIMLGDPVGRPGGGSAGCFPGARSARRA